MSPGEKKSESFTENVVVVQGEPDDFVLLKEENRKAAERHVVRKLDMRLMPTVAIIYLMNYIDVSLVHCRDSVVLFTGRVFPWVSSVWLSLPLDFRA